MKKSLLTHLFAVTAVVALKAQIPMAGPVEEESTEQVAKAIQKSVIIQEFAKNKDRLAVAGIIREDGEDENKIFVALFKKGVLDPSFGSPAKNGVVITYIGKNPQVETIQLHNEIIVTGLVELPQTEKRRFRKNRIIHKTFRFTNTYSLEGVRKKRTFTLKDDAAAS